MNQQVTTSLQTLDASILANREIPGLSNAMTWLAGRVRARTPLGAAEYLRLAASGLGKAVYEERVSLAIDICQLYREFFAREYEASQSPIFSTQREHEFYRLVSRQLFAIDLSPLEGNPDFFFPTIPLKSLQQHDWENGCCAFEDLDVVFRLVLILSGRRPNGGAELAARSFGAIPEPSPPLDPHGWTEFVYACSVEPSPIRHLPLAFHVTSYQTGNAWLDVPPGYMGLEWCAINISRLYLARIQAEQVNQTMKELDQWLTAPGASTLRIARAIQLWNVAALKGI